MNGAKTGKLFEDIDPDLEKWVYIVLVLGVMLFLQKAPKLLKELFPSSTAASGNFGLNGESAKLAARGLGATLGATRAVGGAIGRARSAYQRKKALDPNHKKDLKTKRAERAKEQAAAKRQRKYGAAYEAANAENKKKKTALDERVCKSTRNQKTA